MEPWGTPAQTGAHENDCPFKSTHWNLLLKKLLGSFKELSVMPIHWIYRYADHATPYQILLKYVRKYPWHLLIDYNQKSYKFDAVLREVDTHKNQKVWTQTFLC